MHLVAVFRPYTICCVYITVRAARTFEIHRHTASLVNSLPETEIAEDHVEQVFDVDVAGDAAEAAPGEAEVLGAQLGELGGERAAERGGRHLERLAVARAGQERGRDVVGLGDTAGEGRDQFG